MYGEEVDEVRQNEERGSTEVRELREEVVGAIIRIEGRRNMGSEGK